jgi:hypothetical protein
MENAARQPVSLTRYAWLSIIAAIITITLEVRYYAITAVACYLTRLNRS